LYLSLFFLSKTVLAGSLEVAKNFQGLFASLEISDKNFQNCGNIRDILKKIFS